MRGWPRAAATSVRNPPGGPFPAPQRYGPPYDRQCNSRVGARRCSGGAVAPRWACGRAVGAAWPLAGGVGGCSRGGVTKRPFKFPTKSQPAFGHTPPLCGGPLAECVAKRPPRIVIGYSTPADYATLARVTA